VYSKIENLIFGIITELLKLSVTDINCDELGGKYYLSNKNSILELPSSVMMQLSD
jgi:hypothetical protein